MKKQIITIAAVVLMVGNLSAGKMTMIPEIFFMLA